MMVIVNLNVMMIVMMVMDMMMMINPLTYDSDVCFNKQNIIFRFLLVKMKIKTI